MKKIIVSGISIILALLGLTTMVYAAENGEMSIHPYEWDGQNELTKFWYMYNINKGENYQDKVVVENTGDITMSVKIYPVDGLTTTDGAFALENEDEEKNDIGAWVTLSKNEVTLEPNQQEIIDFTFTVPAEASPGEHIGGIIMEDKQLLEGNQLNVKTRVGVRIYETVPGEIVKKVAIGPITAKSKFNSPWSFFYQHNFTYNLINEGNVQISPDVATKITSPLFGEVISDNQKISGTIFPGKTIDFNFDPKSTLYAGPYTLTVTSNIENQNPVQKNMTFWVIPWKLCLIIVVIVLGLISILYLDEHKTPVLNQAIPKKTIKKTSTKSSKKTKKKIAKPAKKSSRKK
jgi:hypothetical protein